MTSGKSWGDAFRTASADAMSAYRDTLLDPVFRPWAELLLDVTAPVPGEHLLDVATGPGTVAQAAAVRVGRTGVVTACDISPAMLAIARAAELQPDAAPIEYVESPAAPLAVASGSHDVVTCQQGLQFVPDRAAAVAEMFRVLRPGGRVAIAVWAVIERCQPMSAIAQAVRVQLGADLADRYRHGPWGTPDPATWAGLLTEGGFVEVQVETYELTAVFPGGAAQLSASLPASGIASEIATLSAADRAALDERIAQQLEPLAVGDAVHAVMTSNVATAIKARD